MQATITIESESIAATAADARSLKAGGIAEMLSALGRHWPEYLMEAACLGLFMVSACSVTVLLQHPSSAIRQAIPSALVRRAITGVAMGLTAIALIYSPWGRQSGGHLNPSLTLTFLRLGKIEPWDAVFYVAAQFAGAIVGVMFSAVAWGMVLSHGNVRYAATLPGRYGVGAAFVAETVISFLMMTMVLNVSNRARIARFTGIFAGCLVALYITVEAPFSGMSMNAARTFGSALSAHAWNSLWIYFTAPPLGMLLAAQLYVVTRGIRSVFCAKLHHDHHMRCIFRCNYKALSTQA
jgi:aquaporin Z